MKENTLTRKVDNNKKQERRKKKDGKKENWIIYIYIYIYDVSPITKQNTDCLYHWAIFCPDEQENELNGIRDELIELRTTVKERKMTPYLGFPPIPVLN